MSNYKKLSGDDFFRKEAKQTARKMWQFMGKLNQDLKQAIGKGLPVFARFRVRLAARCGDSVGCKAATAGCKRESISHRFPLCSYHRNPFSITGGKYVAAKHAHQE